jgi:acetolactate synthase-1/2/3 large subunit
MIDGAPATRSTITVSDYIVRALRGWGISHVFTLPGGLIAPIIDAIYRDGAIRLVNMHHEQSVAFAVDGFGRFNGTPAVGLGTGPGATNLLTPITSSFLDSIPGVFITGQVQSYLVKGARPVRQFGLQEADICAMAGPVTKGAWRARAAADVPAILDDAIALSLDGRPGPVLVELPSDLQTARIPAEIEPQLRPPSKPRMDDADAVISLFDELSTAERPLVLIGGGVRAARATEACRTLLACLDVPVIASVTALDVLDADDPLRLGLIGMYGNRWVNLAAMEADFVLVLGSKLDFGTIGADVNAWGRGRTIYQVDCDPDEMSRVRTAHTILSDLGEFCRLALEVVRDHAPPTRPQWTERLGELRQAWPDTNELGDCDGINPNVLARELSAASPAACDFVVDAGQHLWWTAQSIQPRLGQRFLPSLGLGPCGYSLPAAIGVALGSHRPVVVVVGDGAFQFNIQELQTVVRNRLPTKILLIDNQCHGSVRQFQEEMLEGRYPTTVIDYDTPDFTRVADAYGIRSREVSDPDGVGEALSWFWEDPMEAALLRVQIPMLANVYPSVPFGAPLNAMAGRADLEPRSPLSRADVVAQGR